MIDLATMKLADWYLSIGNALRAHDVDAAVDMLGLMAVNGFPHEAEELRVLMLLTSQART